MVTLVLGMAFTLWICAAPSFGPGPEGVCQTSIIADLLISAVAGASVSVPVLWPRRERVAIPQ
jgi:hypothetical protein